MTAIYRERLASYTSGAAELVLLHGWGSDSEIWRSLVPTLRRRFHVTLVDLPGFGRSAACEFRRDPVLVVEQLLPILPESAVYCGWSLGGMLATVIAASYPERVRALMTIASNAIFVADDAWSAAMPAGDFSTFQNVLEKNSVKGLRRFNLLQLHGEERASSVQAVLRDQKLPLNALALVEGLHCLHDMDNRSALSNIECPAIHVFGAEDALVPSRAAAMFANYYPDHECKVMSGCGHLPFLSSPDEFVLLVFEFIRSKGMLCEAKPHYLDKTDIGRSFSRAAASYDGAAMLQRRIADHLISLMPETKSAPLMDLGCGTGYSLPTLKQYMGEGELLAADLAPGMLIYAKEHHLDTVDGWLCGDAEDLPLADNSVGLIFSSLALQWCENLPAVYAEIERVLKPGGAAVIATLGPDTLYELRESWRHVDAYAHVNEFSERAEIQSAIQSTGLRVDEWQEHIELMEYEQLSELTRELKNIGAHNVNSGRPNGLTSRARIKALASGYEQFRGQNGLLPATYQVWYVRCVKLG